MNRRRTITMLRCGCLPLEVKTGRYRTTKTPLQQRICQLCENSVEDETHFLNHCKPLTLLWVQLYEAASDSLDVNFYSLSPDQKTLLILQLYVHVRSPLLQVNLSMICLSYANVCWNANHIIMVLVLIIMVLVLMLVSIHCKNQNVVLANYLVVTVAWISFPC